MDAKNKMTQCPACQSDRLTPFYEVNSIPVHSCLMLSSETEAKAFHRGDVCLAYCQDCAFITNIYFDKQWSAYAPNYEDQQAFSPTFNSFAGKLAKDLIERYQLEHKQLIEIGCSKGDFLALMCEGGNNSGTGIDPSVLPGRVITEAAERIEFIQEYYSDKHANIPADFICCRHTLEHIQPVAEFVDYIAQAVKKNPHAPVMIEVPDTVRVLKDAAFEDIYYEHCSYFTPGTLASLIRRAGFAVYDLRWEYAEQYLVIECGLDFTRDKQFEIEESVAQTKAMVDTFIEKIASLRTKWIDLVKNAKANGEKIAIWGSGSKCVAFLSTLGLENDIDSIVDINPNRHGKFIPGIAKMIDPPEHLKSVQPSKVIIMNVIYEQEISKLLNKFGVQAEIISL
jgi:hypothetical protein